MEFGLKQARLCRVVETDRRTRHCCVPFSQSPAYRYSDKRRLFYFSRIIMAALRSRCGHSIFTRRRSFAEYWKQLVARFNDVHASGYNTAGSVRIRMKWPYFGTA